MDENAINILIAIIAIFGSSGFWTYVQKQKGRKALSLDLTLGLAHYRIVTECMRYIERGWITKDEYISLDKYLYRPYKQLGGNGLSEKLMGELPQIRSEAPTGEKVVYEKKNP